MGIDYHDHIEAVIKGAPRKLIASDVDAYLRETYEIAYGIHDHRTKDTNPFSVVAYRDTEALYGNKSPIENRIEQYLDLGIKDWLGYTFSDWLSLPRHLQEVMVDICAKHKRKNQDSTSSKMDDIEKELAKIDKGLK